MGGIAVSQLLTQSKILYRSWWQMLTSMSTLPWKLFASQYRASLSVIDSIYRKPASTVVSFGERTEAVVQTVDKLPALERQAFRRARQGLAPPKEIYEAPYRDRIDWSKFPEWARPTDPDLFLGCGHEG
jgi:hypothetical protein